MSQTKEAHVGRSSPPERISEAVINAVAEAKGINSIELSTPLYDVVDPDALNAFCKSIVSRQQAAGQVTFTYCGYEVTIEDGEHVTLSDA